MIYPKGVRYVFQRYISTDIHLPKQSLATLGGKIMDPEITVKLEMRGVIKVYDAQT